jgi:aconitate hydratase
MLGAGLLAKKAVERGLTVKPYVKTSLAPGSRVVIDYLEAADLLRYLEALGFNLVGFGCTTCIGNSGPLPEPVAQAVDANRLYVAAVLSGNRNFEARIHPQVRANFLASPMLIVAYALAGRMDLDLTSEPLGMDHSGTPVFLRDIWPTHKEITRAIGTSLRPAAYAKRYADIFRGDDAWEKLQAAAGPVHSWESESTYIREPPYFKEIPSHSPPTRNIEGAYVLALLGDTVTTDHISPAGSIAQDSPAGKHLIASGVGPAEFNTYGSRRGNHEVMIRGTFANVRLKNMMVKGTEGGWTVHVPTGEKMSIYDAAVRYAKENSPLLVIAGKQYGAGSSRDWAAKGTSLLGVRAVIAQDYERIHRANLTGMGVLPLQFQPGENAVSLQLTGFERYSISGLETELKPQQKVTVKVKRQDGSEAAFTATARLDTPVEVNYYKHGGILQYVFRQLLKS